MEFVYKFPNVQLFKVRNNIYLSPLVGQEHRFDTTCDSLEVYKASTRIDPQDIHLFEVGSAVSMAMAFLNSLHSCYGYIQRMFSFIWNVLLLWCPTQYST